MRIKLNMDYISDGIVEKVIKDFEQQYSPNFEYENFEISAEKKEK